MKFIFFSQSSKLKAKNSGVTIIEIVIWITLFAALTGIGIVSFNPLGQLAKARNTQRELHLNAIMNSIRQNIADSASSTFSCATGGALPTTAKKMASGAGNYNIASCLTPTYLPNLPIDPSATGAHWTSTSDYDTGYNILRNVTSSEITVSAPSAELGKTISITR